MTDGCGDMPFNSINLTNNQEHLDQKTTDCEVYASTDQTAK